MSDQNHLELAAHYTVRNQIFGPEIVERFIHARQLMMRIEVSFSKAGEVLGCANHSGGTQTCEKLASINDRLFGIRRDRP